LARWVCRGLERDEQVLYGQDNQGQDDHGQDNRVAPQRSVLAALREQGVDVQAAASAGQLLVLPLAALFGAGPGGLLARLEHARAAGYRGLRVSGQVPTARTGASEEAYPWLADSLEELCGTQPLSALCQYTLASTVGTRLAQATATHVGGVRELQLHTTQANGGLVLAGEIDASNELLLLATVRAATNKVADNQATTSIAAARNTPVATFWLDLRRVAFLSIGGCRALAAGTERFRERGGQVVLRVTSERIVARALRLVELGALPNVELVESLQ
jgi:anti-anti-sigma regulatory factor